MSAIESNKLPLNPETSQENKQNSLPPLGQSAKPVVWHMFGADINIRIVDGVPHVNGEMAEPAVGSVEKYRK